MNAKVFVVLFWSIIQAIMVALVTRLATYFGVTPYNPALSCGECRDRLLEQFQEFVVDPIAERLGGIFMPEEENANRMRG